jgi:hypothetical protein
LWHEDQFDYWTVVNGPRQVIVGCEKNKKLVLSIILIDQQGDLVETEVLNEIFGIQGELLRSSKGTQETFKYYWVFANGLTVEKTIKSSSSLNKLQFQRTEAIMDISIGVTIME